MCMAIHMPWFVDWLPKAGGSAVGSVRGVQQKSAKSASSASICQSMVVQENWSKPVLNVHALIWYMLCTQYIWFIWMYCAELLFANCFAGHNSSSWKCKGSIDFTSTASFTCCCWWYWTKYGLHVNVYPYIHVITMSVDVSKLCTWIYIVDHDEDPAYIVKHSRYLLTVEDMQTLYQVKWLNDQVKWNTLT